jgi:hypothetical protein
MPIITTPDKTELYVKHRYRTPGHLSCTAGLADSWDDQAMAIAADAGYRAIAYDRRGRSSQPYYGYDYNGWRMLACVIINRRAGRCAGRLFDGRR